MRCDVGGCHPLRRLFAGLVEQVFHAQLGLCNQRVTDYVSDLLTEFVHADDIYRFKSVDGRVIHQVSEMHAEANVGPTGSSSARRRELNRYIGDFTLFWTGVYPEQLRPRRQGGVDRLDEYLLQGKRSYHIAGDLSQANEKPPAEVLQALASQFEICVHALHCVRAEWEKIPLRTHRN